jgi:anti-sigma regulatory factor (Ser/Thr protein kinase)
MTTTTPESGCAVVDATVLAPRSAVKVVLAAEPYAVRRAREVVARCSLAAGLDGDVADTAVLLTSEVVTNAIMHGRSVARLSVTTGPSGVVVEVGDDESRRPHVAEQDDEALNGRGLAIVDALARRWGVRPDGEGKVVWFEVGTDAAYDRRHG